MPRKSKLLIADSNEINRKKLKKLFENKYNIVEAKNEDDIIRILKKHMDASAIIIDISICRRNSYKILDTITNANKFSKFPLLLQQKI